MSDNLIEDALRFTIKATKVSVKAAKLAKTSHQESVSQVEKKLRQAYVTMDLTHSKQEPVCRVSEDLESYKQHSNTTVEFWKKVYVIAGIIGCIYSFIRGNFLGPYLPLLFFALYGKSSAEPKVRFYQDYETLVRKEGSGRMGICFLVTISTFCWLLVSVLGTVGTETAGVVYSAKWLPVDLFVLIIMAIIAENYQSAIYTARAYATDTTTYIDSNPLLPREKLHKISIIQITNDMVYYDEQPASELGSYDLHRLSDFGAINLAQYFIRAFEEQGFEVADEVQKDYINGNSIIRNKFSKKTQKMKAKTEVTYHAGVDVKKSGYVLNTITIQKVIPSNFSTGLTQSSQTTSNTTVKLQSIC